MWTEAEELILWLQQYYVGIQGEKSETLQKAMLWLAHVYSEANRTADERRTLLAAYATANSGSSPGILTIEAGRHLGLFYYRQEEWPALEGLCKQLLIHFWPSILAQGPHMLPSDHRPSAISFARQLIVCYQKQAPHLFNQSELLKKAEQLYKNLWESLTDPETPLAPQWGLASSMRLKRITLRRKMFSRNSYNQIGLS